MASAIKRSTQYSNPKLLRFYQKTIKTNLKKTMKTQANSLLKTVTKKDTRLKFTPSLVSLKTSSSYNKFYKRYWCYQEGKRRVKRLELSPLRLLLYIILKKYKENRDFSIN